MSLDNSGFTATIPIKSPTEISGETGSYAVQDISEDGFYSVLYNDEEWIMDFNKKSANDLSEVEKIILHIMTDMTPNQNYKTVLDTYNMWQYFSKYEG